MFLLFFLVIVHKTWINLSTCNVTYTGKVVKVHLCGAIFQRPFSIRLDIEIKYLLSVDYHCML